METLNDLESALLNLIAIENEELYPSLKSHIAYLRVLNREHTGVGVYSNFVYVKSVNDDTRGNALLSSSKKLRIENLINELSYVLDITDGKINYLEIVTNGDENWDGAFKSFHFLP